MAFMLSLHAWARRLTGGFPMTVLLTAVTAALLAMLISVRNRIVAYDVFTGVAVLALLACLAVLVVAVRQEWLRWALGRRRRPAACVTPRVLEGPLDVADLYMALTMAFALVYMAPWLYDDTVDKHRHYTGFAPPDGITTRNVWQVWVMFLATSAFTGAGGPVSFTPRSWLTHALFTFGMATLYFYALIVVSAAFVVVFVRERENEHAAAADAVELGLPAPPATTYEAIYAPAETVYYTPPAAAATQWPASVFVFDTASAAAKRLE